MVKHSRAFCTFLLFLFSFSAFSQSGSKFRVDFTDKNNNPYSVSQPLQFLTQRAIDRRARFNIPITEQDLPVNLGYLNGVRSTGAVVFNKSKWMNSCVVTVSDSNMIDSILQLPYVVNVSRVSRHAKPGGDIDLDVPAPDTKISIAPISSDSTYYGHSFNQINMLKGQYLHLLGYQGEGVIIAVLDAGFNNVNTLEQFKPLWDEHRIIAMKDFADTDNNVFESSSHGTSTLSTMAMNLPGQMVGTAPEASYILIRTEVASSESIVEEENWIAGAEYADSLGADVFSTSLGYTTFDDSTMNHSPSQLDGNTARITIGADIAAAKGIIVVNSAGNEGTNPAWMKISFPSDGDSVLCIGAVYPDGHYADFSGKGPAADGRIKPDVVAIGAKSIIMNSAGQIGEGYGTSFSGPIIAGMMACLRQAVPDKSNIDLYNAVKKCASQYNSPDSLKGYGIPDFYCALKYLTGDKPTALDVTSDVTLFPDPFHDHVTVLLRPADSDHLTMEIFDLSGRKLFENEYDVTANSFYRYEISGMDALAAGCYILRFSGSNMRVEKKVIKM